MSIDDPAEPARNATLANRITETEPTNGNAAPPVLGPALSISDLAKILAQNWKTVIIAVAQKEGSLNSSMIVVNGDKIGAQSLAASLAGHIQHGV